MPLACSTLFSTASMRRPSMARAIARFMRRPRTPWSRRRAPRCAPWTRRVSPLAASSSASHRRSMRSFSPGLEEIGVRIERLCASRQDASASTRFSASRRAREVVLAVIERVHQHLLDRLVVEAVARLDAHRLLDPRRQLLGVHAEEAVGVDLERDLEPRHPRRHRRDALEREAREAPVVGDHLALALDDVDLEAGLVVLLRRVRRRAPSTGSSCCAAGSCRPRRRRPRCRARAG
jgi:hypothetical protein